MNKYIRVKLKYLANIYTGNSIPDEDKDNYVGKSIPYIPTKAISIETSTVDYENGLSVSEGDNFRIAPEGSVLLCLEGGSAGRKICMVDRKVAFVNKLCCLKSYTIPDELLYSCLRSADFLEQFNNNISGLIGGVSINDLKNMYVTINTDEETNREISNVLSKKCLTIDKLITKEKESLDYFLEYKNSLIENVVTKGIYGNEKFIDSDIDWYAKVREDWKTVRVKDVLRLKNEKNYEPLDKVNLLSLYTEFGVVQNSDLTRTTGNKAVNAEGYKKVSKGDIIVNIILCWMGAIGVSEYDGVTSPAYDIYEIIGNNIPKYFHYLFRTKVFSGQCYKYGRGIMLMRWRTYSSEFKSIALSLPPIYEQQQIVNFLDKKCKRIDELIESKKTKIKLLNEYKKSLIYEYITGQKRLA